MLLRGRSGKVEKIDSYTVRFRFLEPNGVFLEQLCIYLGTEIANTPEHYLRRFHPTEGDEALIEKKIKALALPGKRALYAALKKWDNPDHPRLWPWVYRTYRANPPQSEVDGVVWTILTWD